MKTPTAGRHFRWGEVFVELLRCGEAWNEGVMRPRHAGHFDNLGDVQRRCEQELVLTQRPNAQFRWEPFNEPTAAGRWRLHAPARDTDEMEFVK
ncbi:hypothetical protein AQI70_36265 [Streptomyces curacoi]|uniref:Uncharacterized protein n=1 Tax=Streptomyces curacoi TaxID=146536 RepID=A0A117NU22_9ACTN|nr:hypothetical protein AQI70_36265 [Streptomyces curacoi]